MSARARLAVSSVDTFDSHPLSTRMISGANAVKRSNALVRCDANAWFQIERQSAIFGYRTDDPTALLTAVESASSVIKKNDPR